MASVLCVRYNLKSLGASSSRKEMSQELSNEAVPNVVAQAMLVHDRLQRLYILCMNGMGEHDILRETDNTFLEKSQ